MQLIASCDVKERARLYGRITWIVERLLTNFGFVELREEVLPLKKQKKQSGSFGVHDDRAQQIYAFSTASSFIL